MITRPFPFNAFYGEDEAPVVDGASYRLEVTGLVADKRRWTLERLAHARADQPGHAPHLRGRLERDRQVGRRALRDFLRRIGADTTAKYVGFKCADDYYTSIDMATALHPQTLLALTYDGQTLPPKYGFPMKLRMPTKLGYKNPKHIARCSSPTPTRAATGKTRATTGSAAADQRCRDVRKVPVQINRRDEMKKLIAGLLCSGMMLVGAQCLAADSMSRTACRRTAWRKTPWPSTTR